MASISLHAVTKRFLDDGPAVLSGVDLEIADGEFIVLVGPSGCGKTTLLRIVAGLETATSGELLIGGSDMSHLPAGDRNIAMVFQNYALFPHLTVAENIGFGLKIRGMPKAERRSMVEEVASLLGLAPYLERRPAAFLMDEPLSNLDAKLRVEMRAEISRMQRRLNATTIYVTHDQTEAMTMGDRVVVLNRGVVQQIAPPAELYQSPANAFVAQFIGAPTMNMLAGSVSGGRLAVGAADIPLPDRFEACSGPVLVGARPEHIGVADPGEGHFKGRVALVEHLGKEVQVHFEIGPVGDEDSYVLVATLDPGEVPSEGSKASIVLDVDHMYLFDRDSGARLPAP